MAALQKLFDTTKRNAQKNIYGQQVNKQKKEGKEKYDDKFLFKQVSNFTKANEKIKLFISDNLKQQDKRQYFQYGLSQQIKKGTEAVSQYNLNQIAQYLPWVFSSRFFFQPFRSIIYCVKNKIFTEQFNEIPNKIPADILNNQCYEAYFQTIKNNATYIGIAKKLLTSNAQQSSFYQSTKQAFWSMIKTFFGENIQTVKLTIQQLTQGLKVYGQIIINFTYLKKIGNIKKINGKDFYYVWNNPTLFIGLNQSYIQIYRLVGNQMTFVSQNQFNINYLRGMVMQKIIKIGGKLINVYNQDLNGINSKSQSQIKQIQKFKTKYLAFDFKN